MMKRAFICSFLVLAALGCSASAPPLPTSTPVPQATATPFQSSSNRAAEFPGPAADVAVGTDVGDRVPHFAIHLANGATVTLDDLIQEERPTFLFFFATW